MTWSVFTPRLSGASCGGHVWTGLESGKSCRPHCVLFCLFEQMQLQYPCHVFHFCSHLHFDNTPKCPSIEELFQMIPEGVYFAPPKTVCVWCFYSPSCHDGNDEPDEFFEFSHKQNLVLNNTFWVFKANQDFTWSNVACQFKCEMTHWK